jgi:hypothetical protein
MGYSARGGSADGVDGSPIEAILGSECRAAGRDHIHAITALETLETTRRRCSPALITR